MHSDGLKISMLKRHKNLSKTMLCKKIFVNRLTFGIKHSNSITKYNLLMIQICVYGCMYFSVIHAIAT